jgi:hypothetical protein
MTKVIGKKAEVGEAGRDFRPDLPTFYPHTFIPSSGCRCDPVNASYTVFRTSALPGADEIGSVLSVGLAVLPDVVGKQVTGTKRG